MYREIELDDVLTVIQEPGIKVRVIYRKENEITMSLRKVYGRYELWISADKSRMGEKYYENYTVITLNEDQVKQIAQMFEEKLNEH